METSGISAALSGIASQSQASTPRTPKPKATAAPAAASVSKPAAATTSATVPASSATTVAAGSSATAPKSAPKIAAAPAQSVSSAASTVSALVSSTYSTNVGGKSYAANISQSKGVYTLSVPNLPGASVTGSSLSAAESALNLRIDLLA